MSTNLSEHSLDYIIMLNAHEESRLPELLADYAQSRPSLSAAEVREHLSTRLSELMKAQKVAMYELPIARPPGTAMTYRDVPIEDALAIVAASENWAWESPPGTKVLHLLFAQDEDYWGE